MARKANQTSVLGWLRKALLLYVLLMVALGAWLARARSTDWNDTLRVAVYPINAEATGRARADVQRYIDQLDADTFADVGAFVEREGARYGMHLEEPLRILLARQTDDLPPAPPPDRHVAKVMLWSLKLRYYAWQAQRTQDLPAPDIRLFVVYHDPQTNEVLGHSVGLQKGLIGVVNAFGSRREASRNNIVIVHELLHTLGATDKYDPATNLPRYPDGYAEPDRRPLLPQARAEIMAGRRPLSATDASMPDRLADVVVGPLTATEIRWIRNE